jgi:hypothetical protein
MELKDFVKETLTAIVQGVAESAARRTRRKYQP